MLRRFEVPEFHGDEDSSRDLLGSDIPGLAASITLKLEAGKSPETLVFYHVITRCHKPEDLYGSIT